MATTYVRGSGSHIAERERPAEGSDRAKELEALAADPATAWHIEKSEQAEPEPVPLEKPTKSASKADWKAYAVDQGLDEEEAETLTRDQLAEKYADGGGS